MPNWCENKLLIKADGKDALDDFNGIEKLLDETLKYDKKTGYVENLLDAIICLPDVLKDTTQEKPYKLPSGDTVWWYQWNVDNWGTKWDVVDCRMYLEDNQMKFTFLTAWAPPINWLEKVGAIFPNVWLKLEYDLPGIMFRGVACGRGEIIDEEEDYSNEG